MDSPENLMLYRVLAVVVPAVVVSSQSQSLLVSNPDLQNMFVAFTDMFNAAVHLLDKLEFQVLQLLYTARQGTAAGKAEQGKA